jgi:hypothetical protein
MNEVHASVPLRTTLPRAAEVLVIEARFVLGDEVGVALRRGPAIRQRVAVDLGGAEPADAASRWALSWEPVGHTVLLPAFSGTLEICELDDGTTCLEVAGTYRPPLGLVGVIVDGAIGHRVAEVSIEHFAAAVARRLDHAALRRERQGWPEPEPAPDLRPV